MSFGIVTRLGLSLSAGIGGIPFARDFHIDSFLSHSSHLSDVDRLSIGNRRRAGIAAGRPDDDSTPGAYFQTRFDSLRRYR